MKFNEKEIEILILTLGKKLNELKDEFEENKELYIIEEIKIVNNLINKILEGK